MTEQWFSKNKEIECYLIDSHRPYNHANINDDESKIFVIHDGCRSFDECPTKEDDRVYHELIDNQGSDEDSDEYGSEYSDLQEAKDELEELKESDADEAD